MPEQSIYESEDGYGSVLVPRGPWKPSYVDLMKKEDIKGLRLSASMGWRGESLEFLSGLDFLHSIEIYSQEIRDISFLGSLSQLRLIGLECDLREPVQIEKLGRLEVLKVTWSKALESFLECRNLTHLNISNWPSTDLQPLTDMKKLNRLQLTSRKLLSLEGLSDLQSLERLDIHSCPKLTSVGGLSSSPNIFSLEISSSKHFHDISPVGELRRLRKFDLDNCGEIDTIQPLGRCESIEELSLVGTTRVTDGDLSVIDELPKLVSLKIAPRKHYNRTRDDFLRVNARKAQSPGL